MLQPDDGPQFATAKQVFNTNYNGYTPAVIVTPTSQLDVQKAMAFAAANNLKVAPRGGGHSYVGASTANGAMVLDLRQLPGDIKRSPALPAQASAGRPSRHPGGSSGVDECVVDAAAVVDALAGKGASAIVLRGLLKESISNAPHLLDAEVGHALRRAVLSDEISEEQARAALDALPYLIDNRYPHSPRLIEYTWQLRHNVTFYDALYVALATALDVPLLTGDSRLAAAPGLPCEIKLVR